MASIYQNNGPGRPPPQGSYRQTQTQLPPPPPPSQQGQYGGHGHHNFPPPPPPIHHAPYAGIGPPGPVPYNPIRPNNIHHGYGSGHMVQGPYGAPPPGAAPPPPQPQQPQQQHGFPPRTSSYPPPPPPPPQNSQPPPPPPPPHQHHPSQPQLPPHHHPPYYPTSQFSHFAPPSQPPPSHDRPSSPPPPPPPSSPPPPPLPSSTLPPPPPPPQPNSSASASVNLPNSNSIKQHKENQVPPPLPNHGIRAPSKEANVSGSGWGSSGSAQAKPLMTPSKHRPQSLPSTAKTPQLHGGAHSAEPNRGETEEEKRLRKKREYEQRKEEEKQRREKEASAALLRKNQLASSLHSTKVAAGATPRGDGRVERKPQYVGAEKIDNKLKKPTTFLCKLKFRNELPDPTAQPKLLSISTNKDRYAKYTITSLEKTHKPKLFVEPDLGIPLDLLDISVYNPPKVKQSMDPEDEELLRDDEMKTPNKLDGIRKKDRPTDKGVSWLVKTQYISPISLDTTTKQPLTERQIKELRETREGRNVSLEGLNNREQQIQAIEESFRVSKIRPVHQTKPGLEPEEILPLLPDFDRWDDQLVLATFDGEATADAENYGKLEASVRDELESRAIMKSFVHSGSDPTKPDKFLSYMVPGVEELMKDMYDEDEEEMSYTWLREYHWELRAEDANSAVTYVLVFGEDGARYLPLPTKLVLQKRRSKEGRSNEDIESQYPVPSRVTIKNRSLTQKEEEQRDSGRARIMEGQANNVGNISGSKRMASDEDIPRSRQKLARVEETDQNLSGDEYMSE